MPEPGFAALARQAAAVATGRLGWSPDRFWAATAMELMTAVAGRFEAVAAAPLDAGELGRLKERFPDGG